jgi:hypothetical protein
MCKRAPTAAHYLDGRGVVTSLRRERGAFEFVAPA